MLKIKELIKEVPIKKEIIKEVENRLVVTQAAPTAVPKQAQTGKLVTDKLIAVLAPRTKPSALDYQVPGSATVNHRPSVEYLLGVDHATGEITNMLAEEREASDDLRSFKVKLRKGVQFHDGLGEFTAKDVVHSWNYYTNDGCTASYSDYFRNDPGSDLGAVGDHELTIRTVELPALLYDYWLSEYRGVPISSKAQWDQGCPQGSAQYERRKKSPASVEGYCALGAKGVEANPPTTPPTPSMTKPPSKSLSSTSAISTPARTASPRSKPTSGRSISSSTPPEFNTSVLSMNSQRKCFSAS